MAPPAFSLAYQYALAGAVGVALILALLLCVRARILERRNPTIRPILVLEQLQTKPHLYDVYLDSHGEFWHEIMPLSIHPVGPCPPNPPKHTSLDANAPLASVLSTIALMIAMPCPDAPPRTTLPPEPSNDSDLEDEQNIPYLEIGVLDVEIPRGDPQISQGTRTNVM
ncbi:hypothetical protein B0H19DRAFT_1121287 [Mycena capillaripes]|nr:hypothetical protein B0H19DRAFT_1121287 [Mycena capillaripes]